MSTPSRPQPRQTPSAIVRDFRHNVDGAFHLEGEGQLSNLEQSVEEKKRVVDSEIRELEELKAKIRATEKKLESVAEAASTTTTGQQEHKSLHASPGTSKIPRAAAYSSPVSSRVSSGAAPPVPSHTTPATTSQGREVKPGPYVPGSH